MPRVIFAEDDQVVELPANATLADALRQARRRARVLLICEGGERLSPPTPRERRHFGAIDWERRLPDQAGIIGDASIVVRGL